MYHPSTTFVTMNSFLHKLPCVHVIYLQYGRVHDTGNKIKYKNIYIKTAIEFEFREMSFTRILERYGFDKNIGTIN